MATRARIGVLNPDGSVTSIYSHWDGYPAGVGKTLTGNYLSEARAKRLVAMGGVSVLEGTVEESTFYHRDRDEDLEVAESFNQMAFLQLARGCGAEWAYLWEDGRWRTYRIGK
jgi:hypothetical protein